MRAAVALVWTGGGGRFAADIQGNDLPADIVDHFGGGDNGERLVASVLAELLGSGYAVVSAVRSGGGGSDHMPRVLTTEQIVPTLGARQQPS